MLLVSVVQHIIHRQTYLVAMLMFKLHDLCLVALLCTSLCKFCSELFHFLVLNHFPHFIILQVMSITVLLGHQ